MLNIKIFEDNPDLISKYCKLRNIDENWFNLNLQKLKELRQKNRELGELRSIKNKLQKEIDKTISKDKNKNTVYKKKNIINKFINFIYKQYMLSFNMIKKIIKRTKRRP